MKTWLKRIRGAVGMGLTWAAGWSLVSSLLTLWLGGPGFALGPTLAFALYGFLGGGFFSLLLGLTEGRRTFEEMSLSRFAVWGALAPLLMLLTLTATSGTVGQLLNPEGLRFAAVLVLFGTGSAAGSLVLARRGDDRELLSASADVENIGLTKEEKRELLGT